jgi:hypothetical protein
MVPKKVAQIDAVISRWGGVWTLLLGSLVVIPYLAHQFHEISPARPGPAS